MQGTCKKSASEAAQDSRQVYHQVCLWELRHLQGFTHQELRRECLQFRYRQG